jgi:hypothetical protein
MAERLALWPVGCVVSAPWLASPNFDQSIHDSMNPATQIALSIHQLIKMLARIRAACLAPKRARRIILFEYMHLGRLPSPSKVGGTGIAVSKHHPAEGGTREGRDGHGHPR